MDNSIPSAPQYGGPTTTANSAKEGRLMVGIQDPRRKILKKILSKKGRASRNNLEK